MLRWVEKDMTYLFLNTESVENSEADLEIALYLTVKIKNPIGKSKEAISSFAYNFGTAVIFYMAYALESLPYLKKYFCTENLLLNLPAVAIIHSKAFYCLRAINKANTQGF